MAITEQTPKQLKEYEERFIDEAWNSGNYDIIEESVSEDYVGHWFDIEEGDVDRDGLEAFIRSAREGFSDFHMDVEFMVAEDDMVTVGFTVEGTHDGEFMGIPPTDEFGSSPGILVHKIGEDGMVVEGWAVWDALGQMQQLGVVPESFTLASFLETGANLAKQDVLKRTKR
ncbi:ester cyclase [Natronomonas sp.]|uniref:ester cyclase n=1 Tax=Natronomonas sp. TaxID=2184060 RepID=UPI002FC363DD